MIKNQGKLWLIGGTQESRAISLEIISLNLPCVVTVTTQEAKQLYPHHPCLRVILARFSADQLETFREKENIQGIIDASHPYALEISQLAMNLAACYHLPYLRYERPFLSEKNAIVLENIDSLLSGNYLLGKRVLLTLGYQSLPLFEKWQKKAILYARILPKIDSLQVALDAGFTPDRLIAFRPPLDSAMEKALWQHWDIEVVVSKASGKAGGEDIKQDVAQALGVPVIIIKRPSLSYSNQTSNLEEVRKFCQQFFKILK